MTEIERHIYNCHGILVGYIVRNEVGGTFFVRRTVGDPTVRRPLGVNYNHITPELREAFRNQEASALRKAFA